MKRYGRGSTNVDEWQRIQDSVDETVICDNRHCKHPVYRHYSGAAGITRLCSLCGCTNWSRST